MTTEIPHWAKKRACELVNKCANPEYPWGPCHVRPGYPALYAFALYIMEHEEEPVDPLLLREARKLVAESFEKHGSVLAAKAIRKGEYDAEGVADVLKILKRGIELAKAGAA